jgi:polar amino acid transport system substrate-binding protein
MVPKGTKRGLLYRLSAGGLALILGSSVVVPAQASGLLEELKTAGSIKVGLANQPPYSGLDPDGSVSGFVPTLIKEIMGRLGVPKVEGFVATYGELIPGLQAGRWHMIGASFRLTKERCSQVAFADPVTFDGGAIAYVPGEADRPDDSLAAVAKTGAQIGILQGSYLLNSAQSAGIDMAKIAQFPNNPSLIDGLLANRVPLVVSTNASLLGLKNARSDAFEIVYPLSDDPPTGSGPAFRPQDTDLHDAFQKELRAMRASGELDKMAAEFGFAPPPDFLADATAESVCASF